MINPALLSCKQFDTALKSTNRHDPLGVAFAANLCSVSVHRSHRAFASPSCATWYATVVTFAEAQLSTRYLRNFGNGCFGPGGRNERRFMRRVAFDSYAFGLSCTFRQHGIFADTSSYACLVGGLLLRKIVREFPRCCRPQRPHCVLWVQEMLALNVSGFFERNDRSRRRERRRSSFGSEGRLEADDELAASGWCFDNPEQTVSRWQDCQDK